jgi:serine/threonine protein kinase
MEKAPPTGRYRDIEWLGSGGMASVTLALDTVLGRLVALKRVHAAGSAREVARLRREALVGASLQHRNLVAVYDVEEHEGRIVIVMEYVRGTTLRDLLASRGVPTHEETVRILDGVANGLDALHARGIIHRDVKPANVLLGEDRAVKLADLGLASVPDRTQSTAGAVFGTFSYMAPEQLEGGRATPAVDIYALAALAFELLAGEKARPELNPLALAHAMATQAPPDLRDRAPETPAPVARLLQSAMSTRVEQRPRTAGELVGRLREALLPDSVAGSKAATSISPAAPGGARLALPAGAAVPSGRVAPTASDARSGSPASGRGVPPVGDVRRARPRTAVSNRTGIRRVNRPQGGPPPGAGKGASGRGASGHPVRSGILTPVPNRRSRASRLLAPLLIAVAALAALLFAINSGSSSNSSTTNARSGGKSAKAKHHGSTAKKHAASVTRSADTATTGEVASPAKTSSTSAAAATESPPPATSTTQASAAVPDSGTSGEAGSPAAAVEAFYGAAARHDYPTAWRLADANMRTQVAGYHSFSAQQSTVRSITFHRAETLPGATASLATVTVATTSVLVDRTEQCSGTVRTVRTGAAWLLDGISINCTP